MRSRRLEYLKPQKSPLTLLFICLLHLNRREENACGVVLDMFVVFPSSWCHRSRTVGGRLFNLMQLRWRWGCVLLRERTDHRPNRAQCFHLLPVSTNKHSLLKHPQNNHKTHTSTKSWVCMGCGVCIASEWWTDLTFHKWLGRRS